MPSRNCLTFYQRHALQNTKRDGIRKRRKMMQKEADPLERSWVSLMAPQWGPWRRLATRMSFQYQVLGSLPLIGGFWFQISRRFHPFYNRFIVRSLPLLLYHPPYLVWSVWVPVSWNWKSTIYTGIQLRCQPSGRPFNTLRLGSGCDASQGRHKEWSIQHTATTWKDRVPPSLQSSGRRLLKGTQQPSPWWVHGT